MTEDRMADVLIFALGTLEKLKADGMVDGDRWSLDEIGRERYQVLKLTGFEPTDKELYLALKTIQTHVPQSGN